MLYRVFIHEGPCRINSCCRGSCVAVGDCCSQRCRASCRSESVVHTENAKHVYQPAASVEPAGAWRSKTFGCGTPAPFAALDCGFCYFHRVYFAELACDRKPSSARSFWVCPLALWRDTEGGGKFTRDLLQPSDISTERAAAARRPGSCGRPCSL